MRGHADGVGADFEPAERDLHRFAVRRVLSADVDAVDVDDVVVRERDVGERQHIVRRAALARFGRDGQPGRGGQLDLIDVLAADALARQVEEFVPCAVAVGVEGERVVVGEVARRARRDRVRAGVGAEQLGDVIFVRAVFGAQPSAAVDGELIADRAADLGDCRDQLVGVGIDVDVERGLQPADVGRSADPVGIGDVDGVALAQFDRKFRDVDDRAAGEVLSQHEGVGGLAAFGASGTDRAERDDLGAAFEREIVDRARRVDRRGHVVKSNFGGFVLDSRGHRRVDRQRIDVGEDRLRRVPFAERDVCAEGRFRRRDGHRAVADDRAVKEQLARARPLGRGQTADREGSAQPERAARRDDDYVVRVNAARARPRALFESADRGFAGAGVVKSESAVDDQRVPVEVERIASADRDVAVHGQVVFEHEVGAVVIVEEVLCAADKDLVLVDEIDWQSDAQHDRVDQDRRNACDRDALLLARRHLLALFGLRLALALGRSLRAVLALGRGGFGVAAVALSGLFGCFHRRSFLLFGGFGRLVLLLGIFLPVFVIGALRADGVRLLTGRIFVGFDEHGVVDRRGRGLLFVDVRGLVVVHQCLPPRNLLIKSRQSG